MRNRLPIILILWLVCLIMLVAAWSNSREAAELHQKQSSVVAQLSADSAHSEPVKASVVADEPLKGQDPSNSSELLRLRAEVSRLTRRKQELSSVVAENQRLKGRLAAAVTNTQGALPAGYIRKAVAQNVGYATPQATIETFLWAMRNKDMASFSQAFVPEVAARLQESIQTSGRDPAQFFKEAEILPGWRRADGASHARSSQSLSRDSARQASGANGAETDQWRVETDEHAVAFTCPKETIGRLLFSGERGIAWLCAR